MPDCDIVKVSWSGGKDSTAAMILHLDALHIVKAVCYVPMFTDSIPLINKKHYEFIMQAKDFFESEGASVTITHGMTYFEEVSRKAKRGKYKGLCIGFPYAARGICLFKKESKLKSLKNANIGYYDYEDIGIAFDEKSRFRNIDPENGKRSILIERKITEKMAKEMCLKRGLLSPQYENGQKRDGCVLCPFSKDAEREEWFSDYLEAVDIVKELQEIVKKDKPWQRPLIGNRWFV